CVQALQFPWTF
nr:immunoglobulin light chain junction region [Macaca mulatta]